MYETPQESSEGEYSINRKIFTDIKLWKSDMHPLFSIAPLRFGSRKRWRDNAMTMARWYDGDHPMTMWQLHDNDEAMLYHIIISTLSHHQHRVISTSALTEKMRSHVSRHKKKCYCKSRHMELTRVWFYGVSEISWWGGPTVSVDETRSNSLSRRDNIQMLNCLVRLIQRSTRHHV